MGRTARTAFAVAALTLVSGCAVDQYGNPTIGGLDGRQVLGTMVGAGAGGLVGSQFGHGSGKAAMTGLGVLAGGAGGAFLTGPRPQQQPQPYQQQQPAAYAPQAYCRESVTTVLVGGVPQQVNGTVCQNPDGTWTAPGR